MQVGQTLRMLSVAALAGLAPAAPAQEPPEAVYAKFHRALVAGNLEEMLRYAPAARRAELAAMPAAQKQVTLELMARMLPKSHSVAGKQTSPDGNRATLHVTGYGVSLIGGKPETQYGTIAMLKEGGEWKVDQSTWDNNPRAQAAAPPAAPGAAAGSTKASPPSAPPAPAMQRSTEAKNRATARQTECVVKPVMTDEDLAKCR